MTNTQVLRDALQCIHDTFKRDMEQGYVTKDKQFAVSIAAQALAALQAQGEPACSAEQVSEREHLLRELKWCIDEGHSGPRTHVALVRAHDALLSCAPAAPQGCVQAPLSEQWESVQMDAFNAWANTAARHIDRYSAMCGWMQGARRFLDAAPIAANSDNGGATSTTSNTADVAGKMTACVRSPSASDGSIASDSGREG